MLKISLVSRLVVTMNPDLCSTIVDQTMPVITMNTCFLPLLSARVSEQKECCIDHTFVAVASSGLAGQEGELSVPHLDENLMERKIDKCGQKPFQ